MSLTILGPNSRYCDGMHRRNFLTIGGLAMGGMGLSQILRAEEVAGIKQSKKAVIMVILPGGPPHLDMVDPKPNAPKEIRGPFKPISTNVAGIQLTELMPQCAKIMDKLAVVRSLYGGRNDHNVHQCLTGWESHPQQGDSPDTPGYPIGGWPSLGAVLSRLQGPRNIAIPPFVALTPKNAESTTRASLNQPGFLGSGYAGFEPTRKKRNDIVYKSGVSKSQVEKDAEREAEIVLKGITLDRLDDRQSLLHSLDRFRRQWDSSKVMQGMDHINRQAFGILTSGDLARALNWRDESRDLRHSYGLVDAEMSKYGGPKLLKNFLIARRLVEAGARCVTLAFSQWPLERMSRGGFNWDWHKDNFSNAKVQVPMLDIGLAGLIRDLAERNMLDDVSVVVWGEFGRTPKINGNAGRDHWPAANFTMLAGGGLKTGQVVGSTTRNGGEPHNRPIHYREVFATLYHAMGIDAKRTTLTDLRGRPHYLVDNRSPVRELI